MHSLRSMFNELGKKAKLAYKVIDGIPVLLPEEARKI